LAIAGGSDTGEETTVDTVIALKEAIGGPESLWLAITNLGSDYAYIVLLALYYWLVDPWYGRRLGMTVGLSFFLNDIFKYLFDAPRPFHVAGQENIASERAIATAGGGGFPSGHAQTTAAFWGALAARHRIGWLTALAVVVIALVALSRLTLAVHFPIDVLGGLVIGLALAAVAYALRPIPMPSLVARLAITLVVAVLAELIFPVSGRTLGVTCGFLLSYPSFSPPRTWAARVIFALIGLVIVFAAYVLLSRLLGSFGSEGVGAFLRYLALTLLATEAWPRLASGLTGGAPRPTTALPQSR
jgi:membrane-associated phospholipid phosphatase